MSIAIKSAIAAAAMSLVHLGSMATPVINQLNTSANLGGFCHASVGAYCGQSFQHSAGNIAGAGFQIAPNYGGANGTVTISIYSGYSGAPSGLVATGVSGIVNGQSNWVDAFWSPAALISGNTYYMVFASNANLVAAYTPSASYAAGNAIYGGDSTTWRGYDLAFRTYSDNGASVPEPMTLGLIGLGLLGLGLSRRKAA